MSAAQAQLGHLLLRGENGVNINVERGMILLEASAAAHDAYGLICLADALYKKSVLRNGEYREKRQDPTSQKAIARIPQLLSRAAAQNSPLGMFYLSIRVYDEIGTPRDDLASKALMQMACERKPSILSDESDAVAMSQPTQNEASEVRKLVEYFSANLQQLPELLATRWAKMTPTGTSVNPNNSVRHQVVDTAPHDDDEATREPINWHAGLVATSLAVIGIALLLMFGTSINPNVFRVMAVLLGLVGGFGVWRTTADFEWGGFQRLLLSAIALVPVLGILVGIVVLWRAVRG